MSTKMFSKAWRRKIKDELQTPDSVNSGGGSSLFTLEWTPTIHPGIDIQFNNVGQDEPNLSNGNHTVIASTGTVYVGSEEIYPSPNTNNTKYAQNFLLGDPNDITNGTLYLGFWKITDIMLGSPEIGIFFVLSTIETTPNNWEYNLIYISDWVDENNSVDLELTPITVPWSAGTEYIIAYDPTAGTYGTIYLYTSQDLNTPIYTYVIPVDYPDPNGIMSVMSMGNASSGSVTIQNIPTYPLPGFTYVGGGTFDENSYPEDREGNGYTVTGLSSPVYIPDYGREVDNGELVIFDNDGNIINKQLWTLEEILSLIPQTGLLGTIPWTPIEDSENPGYLDNDSLPQIRANRSFEVIGLSGNNLIWNNPTPNNPFITIRDGDILVFNSYHELVSHLSHLKIPIEE